MRAYCTLLFLFHFFETVSFHAHLSINLVHISQYSEQTTKEEQKKKKTEETIEDPCRRYTATFHERCSVYETDDVINH